MQFTNKRLVILDRDGVINHDSDAFIKTPQEWQLITGSLAAIKRLNDAGKIVAIATNQSGVARGLLTLESLHQIHALLIQQLQDIDAHIDALEFCVHHPDDACDCRKPRPGMIKKLLQQFNIAPENTLVIGDSRRDLEAASAVKVDAVLVRTGKGEKTAQEKDFPYPIFTDLAAVVEQILHDA